MGPTLPATTDTRTPGNRLLHRAPGNFFRNFFRAVGCLRCGGFETVAARPPQPACGADPRPRDRGQTADVPDRDRKSQPVSPMSSGYPPSHDRNATERDRRGPEPSAEHGAAGPAVHAAGLRGQGRARPVRSRSRSCGTAPRSSSCTATNAPKLASLRAEPGGGADDRHRGAPAQDPADPRPGRARRQVDGIPDEYLQANGRAARAVRRVGEGDPLALHRRDGPRRRSPRRGRSSSTSRTPCRPRSRSWCRRGRTGSAHRGAYGRGRSRCRASARRTSSWAASPGRRRPAWSALRVAAAPR